MNDRPTQLETCTDTVSQSSTTAEASERRNPTHTSPDVTPAPIPKELLEDIRRNITDQEKADAWSRTAEMVKTYSDDTLKRWNMEIDTLLVYGGLFSAILTAFNVQSYQLLQPAGPDPTLAALQQISVQLKSFSVNVPFMNSTNPAFVLNEASPPPAPRWAVWLNSLWFAGLICSLAAASIGIMVKQWLHEFLSGLSGTSREIARRRQFRLRNFHKWHVAEIVACLPVLLQSSLVLFLSGLLVLLWQLHRDVALVASVLIGILLTFMVGTTVLSAFVIDCCYISPITFVIYPATEWIQRGFRWLSSHAFELLEKQCEEKKSFLSSLRDHFPESWRCPRPMRTRRGRGLAGIEGRREMLDSDQVRTAYELTLDMKYLATVGTVCLMDLSDEVAIQTIDHIATIDHRHRLADLADILDPPMDFWAHALLRMSVAKVQRPDIDSKIWKNTESHAESWVLWKCRRAEETDKAARILTSLSRAFETQGHPYNVLAPAVNKSMLALSCYRAHLGVPLRWEDVQYAFEFILGSPPPLVLDTERCVSYQQAADLLAICLQCPGSPPDAGHMVDSWARIHYCHLSGTISDMMALEPALSALRALRKNVSKR